MPFYFATKQNLVGCPFRIVFLEFSTLVQLLVGLVEVLVPKLQHDHNHTETLVNFHCEIYYLTSG